MISLTKTSMIFDAWRRKKESFLEKLMKIILERKILENDIIDKNVNDIWFLKQKKDNFDKNINENYFGEKDSWFLYSYFPVCQKVWRIFLSIVIFINVFVNIIFFLLQESNIIDVFVNDIIINVFKKLNFITIKVETSIIYILFVIGVESRGGGKLS